MTKFRIKPKRDFPRERGFLINGEWIIRGFVVTDGFCNIMPGATWFLSIGAAMDALAIWLAVGGNDEQFWERIRAA